MIYDFFCLSKDVVEVLSLCFSCRSCPVSFDVTSIELGLGRYPKCPFPDRMYEGYLTESWENTV